MEQMADLYQDDRSDVTEIKTDNDIGPTIKRQLSIMLRQGKPLIKMK